MIGCQQHKPLVEFVRTVGQPATQSTNIAQRAGFQSTLAAGASAAEIGPNTAAGIEIAKLWAAVEKSVAAINDARFEPGQAANESGAIGDRAA